MLQRFGYGYKLISAVERVSFSSCCGSKFNPSVKKVPDRKWKNQYGEGVIKGEVDLTPKGISLFSGKKGKEISDEVNEIKHLETRQGVITIAVRKKW